MRHEPLRAIHVVDDVARRTSYWKPAEIDDATVQLIEDVQEYLDGLCGSVEHEVELAVGHPAELLDHTGPIVAAVQESGDQPAVVEFAAAAATERSVPLLAGLVV